MNFPENLKCLFCNTVGQTRLKDEILYFSCFCTAGMGWYKISRDCYDDYVPYIERLKHQVKKFGFTNSLEAVALDSGYLTVHICRELHKMKTFAVIGGRAFTPVKGADKEMAV